MKNTVIALLALIVCASPLFSKPLNPVTDLEVRKQRLHIMSQIPDDQAFAFIVMNGLADEAFLDAYSQYIEATKAGSDTSKSLEILKKRQAEVIHGLKVDVDAATHQSKI